MAWTCNCYLCIPVSSFLGRSSYLSATICDEFIELIGKKVFAIILEELKIAKYYGLSVDSTPDISHSDQLAFCIRYVKNDKPVERFLQFISIQEHNSEYLCNIVLSFLRDYGIDIMDCRAQCFDNANNMAGAYTGLQTRILTVNSLAKFIPCAAHSLCLVGKNAVAKNPKAAEFFNFLETLYLFFARAPMRWEKLLAALSADELVLKRATGTRWSAKYAAVKAVYKSYPKLRDLLISLVSEDRSLPDEQNQQQKAF